MERDFTAVLRGYEMAEVDRVLDRAALALSSQDEAERAAAGDALRATVFSVALRGYDRGQVDKVIEECAAALGGGADATPAAAWTGGAVAPPRTELGRSLRGYDAGQVNQALAVADAALASGSESARASARDTLRAAKFTVVLRGYARPDVEEAVRQRLDLLS